MKGFCTFFKKEMTELFRTYRGIVLAAIALIFGIMNPLIAKLTPLLLEQFSDEWAGQGIVIGKITVSAMDSWAQFEKNYPMLLGAVIVVLSGSYVREYAKGTLIPLVTKGLTRKAVVLSKALMQVLVWTTCFGLYYGVTWGYTVYFWDNSGVQNILFMGFCFWLAGIFLLAVLAFFSSFLNSSIQVLLGAGTVYFVLMMSGMAGIIKKRIPTWLMSSASLLTGQTEPGEFYTAAAAAAGLSVVLLVSALTMTKRRKL